MNVNSIRHRKWFKENKDKIERLPFDGAEIYKLKGDLIESEYSRRFIQFRRVIENRDNLKTSKENRFIIYDKQHEALNKGDMASAAQYLILMRSLDALTLWEEEIIEICDAFILLPGEPIKDFSKEHSLKKREMFKDPETKVFFCNFGIQFLMLMDDSLKNINASDYLNSAEHKLVKQMYSHLIHKE